MASDDEILRIAAQFDVGSITAGMDEAAATVNAGTSKMNDSFSSLAAAQIRVASAQKELREALAGTVSKGLTPTVSATEEVAAAMYEAKSATDAFKVAQQEAYGATQQLVGGVNNARVAFTGLTQDLGLRGSRALGSFISQSSLLGPILQAAFPVVAAIAFFEILEAGYTKILDVTSAMAGWDKEAKHMYDTLVGLNREQINFNEHLAIEKLSLNEVGLKGAALEAQKMNDLIQKRLLLNQDLRTSEKEIASLTTEKEGTTQTIASTPTPYGASVPLEVTTKPSADRLEQIKKSLDAALAKSQELKEQLATLDAIEVPKTDKEGIAKRIEEAQKYTEALVKMADDDAALTQREADKELRSLEALMKERERLHEQTDEEIAKSSADALKKDVEDFRRSVEAKMRLEEEFGRTQLQQIASTAQREETMARRTALSPQGGDEQAAAIATKAFEQEATVVAHLIQLQEQLRATMIASGLAASSPEVLKTLQAEDALIRQVNIDWQKMHNITLTESQQISTSYKNAFEAITGDINKAFLSWTNGTETFGKAFSHVWVNIADAAETSLLKTAELMVLNIAEQNKLLDGTKLKTAGKAARDGYTSVMSAVPFPANVVLAPVVAAGAFAAVMAFEQGGIMPNHESIALLHPREMVLPSHISESVQRMAAGGGQSGRAGGGNIHVHNHFSGSPSSSDIANVEKSMVAAVKRARRRGSF